MGDEASTDAQLVEASQRGDVDAFGALVQRYQSLICAVSFASTGNQTLSEDIAQETFVTAWRGLSGLREPAKLRSWLCGIARKLSSKALRGAGRARATAHEAQQAAEVPLSPLEAVLERESEAVVWAALAEVPQRYRETLVLFYREEQSTAEVARALGLSQNAVQQRLSRGRQYLKAGVSQVMEGSLQASGPPRGFAGAVIASISAGLVSTAEASSAASAKSITAITIGALSMKAKIAVAALLVVLLGLGATSLVRSDERKAGGEGEPAEAVENKTHLRKLPPQREVGRASPPSLVPGEATRALALASVPVAQAAGPEGVLPESPKVFSLGDYKAETKEQFSNSEALWQECLEEAGDLGESSGNVRLSFIIAQPADAEPDAWQQPGALVEVMNIDWDQSSITNASFLECVRRTPSKMTFHPPPRGVDAVSLGVSIVVENGDVAEFAGREFAALRDSDRSVRRD